MYYYSYMYMYKRAHVHVHVCTVEPVVKVTWIDMPLVLSSHLSRSQIYFLHVHTLFTENSIIHLVQFFPIFTMCSKHCTIRISRLIILYWTEPFCRSMYGCQDIFVQLMHMCMSSNPMWLDLKVVQEIKCLKAPSIISEKVLRALLTTCTSWMGHALKCWTYPRCMYHLTYNVVGCPALSHLRGRV